VRFSLAVCGVVLQVSINGRRVCAVKNVNFFERRWKMKPKRARTILAMGVVLTMCFVGYSAAEPISTAFTYQGRLIDANSAADGLYDFQFKLYDANVGGNKVSYDVNTPDVDVIDGYFTVALDFGGGIFDGNDRWLEIGVRAGEFDDPNVYTLLSPRQELAPTPYAIYALTGGGGGMLSLPYEGTVDSAETAFSITNSLSGHAIKGCASSSGVIGPSYLAGVYGEATNASENEINYGGLFTASGGEGIAVYGTAPGTSAKGVYAYASAQSGTNYGIYGRTRSSDGYAGYFVGGRNYFEGKVGIGTVTPNPEVKLEVAGPIMSSGTSNVPSIRLKNTGTDGREWRITSYVPGDHKSKLMFWCEGKGDRMVIDEDGKTSVKVLEILGGADLSEQFQISSADAESSPSPGMVVSIDPGNPGDLVVSNKAYDRRVAGIISGAGGINPGMLMGQKGSKADGTNPVALTGRVYCWVDASNGAIEPGDLLTTSDTPGHAMKVTDYTRAQGAILGKAMSSLEEGEGLVLVLVTLQ
jgi:hypothetical protein